MWSLQQGKLQCHYLCRFLFPVIYSTFQNVLIIKNQFPTYFQVFAKKFLLARHIQQVHVEDRPFVCPQCGKVFIVRDTNILHFFNITAQKSFPGFQTGRCHAETCQVCPRHWSNVSQVQVSSVWKGNDSCKYLLFWPLVYLLNSLRWSWIWPNTFDKFTLMTFPCLSAHNVTRWNHFIYFYVPFNLFIHHINL